MQQGPLVFYASWERCDLIDQCFRLVFLHLREIPWTFFHLSLYTYKAAHMTTSHCSLLVPPSIPIITSLLPTSNSGVSKGEGRCPGPLPYCTQFRASTYHCTATWRQRKEEGRGGGPQGISQTYLVYRPFLVQKMKVKHKEEEEENEIPGFSPWYCDTGSCACFMYNLSYLQDQQHCKSGGGSGNEATPSHEPSWITTSWISVVDLQVAQIISMKAHERE